MAATPIPIGTRLTFRSRSWLIIIVIEVESSAKRRHHRRKKETSSGKHVAS